MADLSLHAARDKVLEQRYVKDLEKRTARRELARLAAIEQTQKNASARQGLEAQALKSAEVARTHDDVERLRDAQLAVELRRLEQDQLDLEARARLELAAQDAARLELARQTELRATEQAPTESRFAAALAADAREADNRPQTNAYREQNSYAGLAPGSILDLEA